MIGSPSTNNNGANVHIHRSGSVTVTPPPKLNNNENDDRLRKLDQEFQRSINRLTVASELSSPSRTSSSPTITNDNNNNSKSPYQLELEHAKRREAALKERLRSSQKILEQQRKEADAARQTSNFRNEIAKRIELDAVTRDMAVNTIKKQFDLQAKQEVNLLESKLTQRREEVLRQTRSQLNLDFTRRIEEQHKEFEVTLDDEVRNMAAKMTRSHQAKLKELASAYVTREKQKKHELENRMKSIENTEEKALIDDLSKKQVNVLTQLKAELQFQMEQRLSRRKREIEQAHQKDRRARLLEIGKEIKKINDEEIDKLKRHLEQEKIDVLNQLEDEMRKEHERDMERLKEEMNDKLIRERESRRKEWGSGYSHQKESLRARLEHDSSYNLAPRTYRAP